MQNTDNSAQEIFFRSLDCDSPEKLADFLVDACGSDTALRGRVEKLLQAHSRAGEFLGGYTRAESPNRPQVTDSVETQVGPYKLLEVIGEGGMGTVYMAEQTEPVKRRVALKLIKTGMDTRQVVARFEAERQALALMDHPNIAKVHDAGATDMGRPYFVMELVKGKPITQFCDEQRLDTEARLKLFQKVCQAVQHAHQKGIIHRDIKPSNVMVAMYDDQPVPKVIDFGVAKATGDELTEQTEFTRFGQIVGTLEYMSPEQAQFNNLDIDTRSDVYSLGAILYELLAGEPPFERVRIKSQALDETLRMIREDEPTKPSTKMMESARSPKIAARRMISSDKLGSILRGDLDWIVMKAIEKDRAVRYESASKLADDIHLFLNKKPVSARPPSTFYRLKKYLRRNRTAVAILSLIGLFLLIGVAGLVASNRVLAAAADRERISKQNAKDRLVQIEKVNEVIISIFQDMNIEKTEFGQDPLAAVLAERLIQSGKEIDHVLIDDSKVEARMKSELADSLSALGYWDDASKLYCECWEIRRHELGPDARETVESWLSISKCKLEQGRFLEAQADLEKTYQLTRTQFGLEDALTLRCMDWLARAYAESNQLEAGIDLLEKTCRIQARMSGPDSMDTANAMYQLAVIYRKNGQFEEALPLLEQTLSIHEDNLGPAHIRTLNNLNSLAVAHYLGGRFDLARELMAELVAKCRSGLGKFHPLSWQVLHNFSVSISEQGQPDDAIKILGEVLALRTRHLGVDHPDSLSTLNAYGHAHLNAGRFDLAFEIFERSFGLHEQRFGAEDPATLSVRLKIALVLKKLEKNDEAILLLEQTLDISRRALGAKHITTLKIMVALAGALRANGQTARALSLLNDAEAPIKKVIDPDDPLALQRLSSLGAVYLTTGRLDQALPALEQSVELYKSRFGLYYEGTQESTHWLAKCYAAKGRPELAISILNEVLECQRQSLGEEHPRTLNTMRGIATLYWRMNDLGESIPRFESTLEISTRVLGRNHRDTLMTLANLSVNYLDAGKVNDAIPLLKEAYDEAQEQPQFLFTGTRLADALLKTGQNRKASELISNHEALVRKHLRPDSPELAAQLGWIGYCRSELEEFAGAADALRNSLEISLKTTPENWETFNTKCILGRVLLHQEKFAEAESFLLDGYRGLSKRSASIPQANFRIARVLQSLVELYETWDVSEPNRGHDQQSEDWKQLLEEHGQ